MNNKIDINQTRRQFISTILPACALTCFGCSSTFANTQSTENTQESATKEKFQNDFCRTSVDGQVKLKVRQLRKGGKT
jgi:hypothetical protein